MSNIILICVEDPRGLRGYLHLVDLRLSLFVYFILFLLFNQIYSNFYSHLQLYCSYHLLYPSISRYFLVTQEKSRNNVYTKYITISTSEF